MKKLIFCFDGTGNQATDAEDYFKDSSISNILKLHLYLGGSLDSSAPSLIENQSSFYYSGIGTQGNWLKRLVNQFIAPSFGDYRRILEKANQDLQQHYQNGDEVYIFGFSRGAAIARMFAAKLNYTVNFLGVFDTVSATLKSLDLNPSTFPSSKIVFENQSLATHILEAVHLLALDEKRLAFQPTLFNQEDRVTEVWFSGAHADIGGGYWHDGLSDICLNYMLDKIRPHLDVLSFNQIQQEQFGHYNLCLDDIFIKPMISAPSHEQEFARLKSALLSPRQLRVDQLNWPVDSNIQAPLIHYSVLERFEQLSSYRPYALRQTRFKILNNNGEVSEPISGLHQLNTNQTSFQR